MCLRYRTEVMSHRLLPFVHKWYLYTSAVEAVIAMVPYTQVLGRCLQLWMPADVLWLTSSQVKHHTLLATGQLYHWQTRVEGVRCAVCVTDSRHL